jgi:predicted transcriptional regulator
MNNFRNGNSAARKLTATQVQEIRELYAKSNCTQGQLSKDFGVSVVQIGRIVRGEVWQKLPQQQASPQELETLAEKMMRIQKEVLGELEADGPIGNPLDE